MINPWHDFIKYFVKNLSPILFSCGITLSVNASTFIFELNLTSLPMVPNEGPKNGNQNGIGLNQAYDF